MFSNDSHIALPPCHLPSPKGTKELCAVLLQVGYHGARGSRRPGTETKSTTGACTTTARWSIRPGDERMRHQSGKSLVTRAWKRIFNADMLLVRLTLRRGETLWCRGEYNFGTHVSYIAAPFVSWKLSYCGQNSQINFTRDSKFKELYGSNGKMAISNNTVLHWSPSPTWRASSSGRCIFLPSWSPRERRRE